MHINQSIILEKKVKSVITSVIAAAGLMIIGSALATDMPELAKKSGCAACYSIDKKIVGPAWMDVSKACNSNGTTTPARETGVRQP
ncbi:MAG: hypothetical protein WBQ69_12960 [Gallionella sp.]